jgi:hypothetical protein
VQPKRIILILTINVCGHKKSLLCSFTYNIYVLGFTAWAFIAVIVLHLSLVGRKDYVIVIYCIPILSNTKGFPTLSITTLSIMILNVTMNKI